MKSTDAIVQVQTNSAFFTLLSESGLGNYYGFSAKIKYEEKARIFLSGWFPRMMIYDTAQEKTSEIVIKNIHSKKEKWSESVDHKEKLDSDIWLVGELFPSIDVRLALIKKFLTCYK